MKIVTRAEAKRQGVKRYSTGEPCIHGHMDERNVHGACLTCSRLRSRTARQRFPEKVRATYDKWVSANRERTRQWAAERRARDPTKAKEVARRYRDKHPEMLRERARLWAKLHKYTERKKERRRSDPVYRAMEREYERRYQEKYPNKRPEKAKRYHLEGPLNPIGERQWLKKNAAQLRAVKRTIKDLRRGVRPSQGLASTTPRVSPR